MMARYLFPGKEPPISSVVMVGLPVSVLAAYLLRRAGFSRRRSAPKRVFAWQACKISTRSLNVLPTWEALLPRIRSLCPLPDDMPTLPVLIKNVSPARSTT
jgi:hypothetical protein